MPKDLQEFDVNVESHFDLYHFRLVTDSWEPPGRPYLNRIESVPLKFVQFYSECVCVCLFAMFLGSRSTLYWVVVAPSFSFPSEVGEVVS